MDNIEEEEASRKAWMNRRKFDGSIMTTAATGLSDEFYYVKGAVCEFIISYHVYRMTRDANHGDGYTDEDWSATSKAMERTANTLKKILRLETDRHVSISDLLFIQTLRYEMLFTFCPPHKIGGFYELTRDKYISYLKEHGDKWFI
jgi:hypothetical protein